MAAHQRGQDPLGFTQEEHEQRKAVLRAWRAPAGARVSVHVSPFTFTLSALCSPHTSTPPASYNGSLVSAYIECQD